MRLNKEILIDIISLCETMSIGREDGTINQITYTEKFKPYLTSFKAKYGDSPNLFLQNELKLFYDTQLDEASPKIDYKSFGFWGRAIYNYTWSCIYFDFDKEAIPASYSPQLYIVVNRYGVKFGFCYGNYVEDTNDMVTSALSEPKLSLLKKCFSNDPKLQFYNSEENEITASPEKLFDENEQITDRGEKELIKNWSSRSLLIKEFKKNNIPNNIEEVIQSTLLNLKDFYLGLLPKNELTSQQVTRMNVDQVPFDENTLAIQIRAAGLTISNNLIKRFVGSLLTKPFVILTGLSGSGKTKLAQAFSTWICEDSDQYCIVPVGSDWTNREPLLGFPNALKPSEYVKPENKVLDLIIKSNDNQDKPYFLILDEMNLSHVERYFADFLSVMESKETISLHSGETDWNDVPARISFPKNLFIIGTVNIDETTYMFSPKVLDRANVIEFRVTADEMKEFLDSSSQINLENLEGKGSSMAASFVSIAKDLSLKATNVEQLNSTLLNFFSELKKTGAEFGYRSASEIIRFAAVVNKLDPSWSSTDIIDAAIMQKLLPKIHGSRRKLEDVLLSLARLCVKDDVKKEKDFKVEGLLQLEDAVAVSEKLIYPISFEKISRMYKGLHANGFTSYAEA